MPRPTFPDQLGLVVVSISGDDIRVMGLDKGEVFVAKERFFSRVLKILVQPSENGEVFVFELNERHCSGFRGCKMKVSWEDYQGKCWLGCERLGAFIVARSNSVFVITRTSGSCCSVRALLESESLDMAGTEEFVAFAKAGSSDHSFGFLLAFRSYLYLCDQRSGVPLLKWQHDVEKLCFIDVYSLSDLGFQTDESTTSCVVVGSFWNAESQMFCYGPSPSVASDPSSLYVWELPHNLLSPAGKCLCGDCAIREVIMKESLPVWIDLQKKRVPVLGFGVLNKYLPSLSSSDGFTLIQLKSSGKLEALKFRSSPSLGGVVTHRDSTSDEEELCEKLNLCGFGRDRCSSTVTAVFDSINSPTSVLDIALRETWSSLPIDVLLLAFSNYTEVEVRPGVDLIGPVLPLPVLLTLHELRNGCVNLEQQELFSPDAEFAERCNQISKAASEMANSGAGETTIPLDDDMWLSQKEKKRFIAYSPITKTDDSEELTKFVSKALVSQWQDRSSSYQDFLSQYHLQK
ncbi:hypothetical protein F2Q69_00031218 [Brassica cretica]|uniref:Uncharacterized protein n=1 Tax=Brassica cretica TaxID=69181 RepID=A0A8S9RX41_BRACR|nr:hypothetical protein F2Q69_00031218 [Brassica cretica]